MADITNSKPATGGTSMNIGKILLEGRAFFALVAIIIVFSILSPVYFSVGNFLIMSSHVAIFGLLAIGMLLVRPVAGWLLDRVGRELVDSHNG